MLYAGCAITSFSLFVIPLQSNFGWGRGQIMVAFMILHVLTGVASPFVGSLIDRYGARWVMSLGAFTGGLGFVSLSLIHNIWHYYGGYVITAIGMAAIGPVSSSTVVSNWFKKRRGTAIGTMSIGIGMGMLTMPLLVGGYLIPSFGWRASYLALAVLMWILIPLVLVVVRTKPMDIGLYPDGVEVSENIAELETPPLASEKIGLKMALGTSAFWLIGIAFFVQSFSALGFSQSQAPHLQDIGYSLATAASVLTAIGLGSTIGKFIFGWLCDHIQAKYACSISFGLLAIGIFALMNVNLSSPLVLVWLYAFVLGLGGGGWLPTLSMLISTK
ncbi:MFS transporter, partial [Chloroflexota bacterium]